MSSGRRVIAAIGIDEYQARARLTNAVSDARGAVAVFEKLGFELAIPPLLDGGATRDAIQTLVNDDLRSLGPDDSLVLFFAGHGTTRNDAVGTQTGYLIPTDASEKASTWIELDSWLRAVGKLPAKHILVILDACHSGIALGAALKWRDVDSWQATPLPTLQSRRSRRIITSALGDQIALDSGPVPDHSLFTGCLIQGLTRDLGTPDRRVTTGSELGLYLQKRVEAFPDSRQTPDFGTFDYDDRGELLISLDGTPLEAVVAGPPPPPALARGGPAIVLTSSAAPSKLEHQLASVLSSIFDTEQEIVTAASAAGLAVGEVARFPRPIDTWQALIAAQRGTEVLRTILASARERTKRVDWSVFDPLLQRSPSAALTSLALSIAWKSESDTDEPFRVVPASANSTLAVRAHVFGVTDVEPRIEVATRSAGGRTAIHTVGLARVAGSNTWAGEVGIAASWRTRTLAVRARAGDQVAHTKLTLTSGINQAAALGCWAACLVFALYWLWPLELTASRLAGFVPLGIVAIARAISALKLRDPGVVRFLRGLVECVERAAIVAALLAVAVWQLPRLLLVEVYNDTSQDQMLGVRLPAGEHRVVPRWSIKGGAPSSDLCVCPTQPSCPCTHTARRGMRALELHCASPTLPAGFVPRAFDGCAVQQVEVDLAAHTGNLAVRGQLSAASSWPRGLHALRFLAATKLPSLDVLARDGRTLASVRGLDLPAGATLELLAEDGGVTLDLAEGTLSCPPHSQLLELAVPATLASLGLSSDGAVSTWTWRGASGPARLCVPATPPTRQALAFGVSPPGIHVPLAGLSHAIKVQGAELTCPTSATEVVLVSLPDDVKDRDLPRGTIARVAGSLAAACAPLSPIAIGARTCRLDGDAIRCGADHPKPACWAPAGNLFWRTPSVPGADVITSAHPPCTPCTPHALDLKVPMETRSRCSSLCTCP